MTFDIEEWFIEKHFRGDRSYRYKIFDEKLSNLLDALDDHQLKGTFFCLGKIAEEFPQVIRLIADKGHEIGCHSYEHKWLTKMTSEELKCDTQKAIAVLEDVCGKKVVSYRSPAFSIGENNKWAIEILAECGIKYDASIFPAIRDFGGFSSFLSNEPCIVEYKGAAVKEFPVCMMSLLGKKTAYSGGGYFRLLPYWMLEHKMKHSAYVICYFHLLDLITDAKRVLTREEYETYFKEPGTLLNRCKRYFKGRVGSGDAFGKMVKLLSSFDFLSIEGADAIIDWEKVNVVKL